MWLLSINQYIVEFYTQTCASKILQYFGNMRQLNYSRCFYQGHESDI